jgi:hypothetical protein
VEKEEKEEEEVKILPSPTGFPRSSLKGKFPHPLWFSHVMYMVVLMFLGQEIVKIKWKLEGTCFNIPVSVQTVTKIFIFEYPDG